ncbi:MAG TPA: alpha/beta-type small acid-soluble spore protein [Candidatus Atribacteria bacterium]|nr:alpha/beta-type small acid-soluble spore protein [Candidatus Atribacteria bacterium]HPT77804.1 alpha/beta-type small acid-soluble spore protein [Candidatus Atribacteria bacterium]
MAGRKSKPKAVPEAENALNKMKFEVADQLGVDLKEGYNGDLTSKEAGSIGGQMVKKMIEQAEKQMSRKQPK